MVAPAIARDARAPHAAGDHDVLGLDAALVGHDARHAPVLGLDVEHLGVREHLSAPVLLRPRSRISVPARSESTPDTLGV